MSNLNLTDDETSMVRNGVAYYAMNFQQTAVSTLRKIEIETNIPAKGSERDWLEMVDPEGGYLSEEDQQKVDAANVVAAGFPVSESERLLAKLAVAEGLVEPLDTQTLSQQQPN